MDLAFATKSQQCNHTAFGEAVGNGVGLRSTAQGYWGTVSTRQGYGLTEQDEATGLNHAWFRKNERAAGRWTSPDPYKGSMSLSDPQSFNRYSYVENQPTNFLDPSGLVCYGWWVMTSNDGGRTWQNTGIFITDYCDNDGGNLPLPSGEPPVRTEPGDVPVRPPTLPTSQEDDPAEKRKKRRACERAFQRRAVSVTRENYIRSGWAALGGFAVIVGSGGTATIWAQAGTIVTVGASNSVAISQIWDADHDRIRCLQEAG